MSKSLFSDHSSFGEDGADSYPRLIADGQFGRNLAGTGQLLGLVRFGSTAEKAVSVTAYPVADLPLALLGTAGVAEAWVSTLPVEYGQSGPIAFGANGQVLFGALHVPEQADDSLDNLTYRTYVDLLEAIRALGYPHLVRAWNYFSNINQSFQGLERYQRFSVGRFKAFDEFGYRFDGDLPAASAIGTSDAERGLWIYFLACTEGGTPIENPRQVSAYQYPVQYGPRSPSFSRATVVEMGRESHLYISGTASIRGHSSVHVNDLAGQLAETVTNLESLLNQPQLPCLKALADLTGDDHLKVYVRHAADVPAIRSGLAEVVNPSCPMVFLQGDICRPDLLLEIEGVVRYSHRP